MRKLVSLVVTAEKLFFWVTFHQCKLQSGVFHWGPSGSWNHSTGRRLGRLSVHARERKTSRVAASSASGSVSFFSFPSALLTHAAPERQQRYTEGVNHTLAQCIPSFPLSFCLPFISFLLMGGGGGVVELEKTKTPGRKRMEKEEKKERERRS